MTISLADRFWAHVDRSGDCWVWTGHRNRGGYGTIQLGGGTPGLVHRVSWTLANGPIPAGLLVLHRCDNRPCVRPAHLFLGTYADNNRDMARKGRHVGTRRLKPADVVVIRASAERPGRLARRFGVRAKTIRAIREGRRWRTRVVTEYSPQQTSDPHGAPAEASDAAFV